MKAPDRREVFYYDSYGLKPDNIHIIRFIKKNSMFKKYNDKILQSHCAATCGQHCLYFLWHCVRGYPPSHVLSHFKEKKRTENDQRVTVFVNRNFTLTPPTPILRCRMHPTIIIVGNPRIVSLIASVNNIFFPNFGFSFFVAAGGNAYKRPLGCSLQIYILYLNVRVCVYAYCSGW